MAYNIGALFATSPRQLETVRRPEYPDDGTFGVCIKCNSEGAYNGFDQCEGKLDTCEVCRDNLEIIRAL